MHPSNYQFDKYKKYRNVLNRAIEGAKRNYYNKIVTEEKLKGPFPLRAWKKAFFVCFIAFFLRSLQF